VFPKQFQQFEAIAYHNGDDRKPDTKDDLDLGAVDVTWSIEEYTATFDDTDKDYVGSIDDRGLFTPNVDGPNPKRKGNANNTGDVWVIATLRTPDGRSLRARAHLLVTVPLYVKFDQPEVAQ
jgi:quinohemoprotein amine dehydrogenase